MAKVAKGSRGGAKPGERRGGRQKGTRNKKTAALVAAVEASGATPLEIMLTGAREFHAKALALKPDDKVVVDSVVVTRLGLMTQASELAARAAPYVHAHLKSVEHKGEGGGPIRKLVEIRFV